MFNVLSTYLRVPNVPALPPNKPFFTQREVLSEVISDFDNRLFQTWLMRDYFTLQDAKPGRGKQRKMSFAEIVKVAAFSRLIWSGHRPVIVKRLLPLIEKRAAEVIDQVGWDLFQGWYAHEEHCLEFHVFADPSKTDAESSVRGRLWPSNRALERADGETLNYQRSIFELDAFIYSAWNQMDRVMDWKRLPWREEFEYGN